MHVAVVSLHIAAAVAALVAGPLAVRFPNGTPTHRRCGRVYVVGWTVLASAGLWIGMGRTGLSAFEVLNALGASTVLLGLVAIRGRRRLGPRWKRWHYRSLIVSYGFLVAATLNQVLVHLGLRYPLWVFGLLGLTPFLFLPRIRRRLDREFGFAPSEAGR